MRLACKPLLALAILALGVAVPAFAQQPSGYPAACEASKVSKSDVDRAHTVYLSGKQYLEESNYDKAISYFKDAYSIDCSVHGLLPIIATAYERKGDKAEAIRALQEYQKRAANAPDHDVIERRIRNLQDQLGPQQPTATTSAPAVTATAATSSAPTGPARVEPGAPSATSAAPAAAAPTSASSGGHSAMPWVLVGAGGAAVVAGIVIYVVGAGDVSDAEQVCGPNHDKCPVGSPAVDKGNNGRTLEAAGGVVGGVGLAAVIGGIVWHIAENPGPARTGVALRPALAPGYAGVSLGGRF